MTAWLVPVVAGAFWAGILAWPLSRGLGPPWPLLAAGLLALGWATRAAPASVSEAALLRAGAVPPGTPAPLQALGEPCSGVARAPPGAVVVAAVLAFGLLGAGWAGLHELRVHRGALASLVPREVTVWGSLAEDPGRSGRGWTAVLGVGRVRVAWDDGRIEDLATSEAVWLEGFGPPPRALRGDRVEVSGPAEPLRNGPFAVYLDHRGIAVVLRSRELFRLGPSANPLVRAAQAVRTALVDRLADLFPSRQAGLLMGLALGDTSRLDRADEEHFRATGLGHLLAVSGENVAMVLAPMVGLAVLLRLSARGRFVLGLATVMFFVVLTGAEPSVLRAGVMAGFALAAMVLGRPRTTATLLGAAVLALLVANPTLVWSVGFQLSVAATVGMVALAAPIAARLGWLPKPVALAAATTMSAQLGVSPLLLAYFHQVPVVTIVANLLAFPAVSPALLLGLAAGALVGPVEPLARPVARVAGLFVAYLQAVADRLAVAPLPSITSGRGAAPVVAGFALLAALTWWMRRGHRLPRPAVVALGALLPLFVWSSAIRAGPPAGLQVRFLDVGQGDAALVTTPEGGTVLVDGGPDPQEVATDLAGLGVKRIDVVVATHPHLDHFTGLPAVLARFPTGLVLDSGCHPPESRSLQYRAFLTAVRSEGVPERHPVRGEPFFVGRLRIDVLSPDRCWEGTNSDANNDSLVLLLSYGEDRVLFANEPEASAQQVMLDDHQPITAQVLNVPHHGAGTSIAPFLDSVHEAVAVVSVGPNDYGHPVPWVIEELRRTGARVFRTDRSGDVTVIFADPGLVVHTAHGLTLEFT